MSFRAVTPPECPPIIACGDIVTDTIWSNVVHGIEAIHEGGHVLFTAHSQKVNSVTIPLLGLYGNAVAHTTTIQYDYPIEIFPGYTHYALILEMKLFYQAAGNRYQTVQAIIIQGGFQQVIATYTSNPLANGNIGTAQVVRGDYGILTQGILPPFGNSVVGTLRLVSTKTNPAGSTVGAGYYDGFLGVTLKQVKPC